tara:strand:- start:1482 stop:2387 length:906 start_codon:yes stop_codon:yes gene_type:complete
MKNILITGGSGFLGRNLAKKLKNKNIFIYDKVQPNYKCKFIKGSILNSSKINENLKTYKIDTIIHLAASLGVSNTEKKPSEVIDINFLGTLNILKAITNTKVKKFIFASSSEVYGDNKKKMIENLDLKPKSLYGHTKILGENLVKTYSNLLGFDYLIFRFFNVCGYGQREDFVISKFFKDIKEKKEITVYGSGIQKRSFCHVKDACNAIVLTINKKIKNQIFNIGNNKEPISIKNLAILIRNNSKYKCKIKFIPFKKTDRSKNREIYYREPDLRKIFSMTNYMPKINLIQIIKEYTDQQLI